MHCYIFKWKIILPTSWRDIYVHIVRTAENRGLKPAFPIGWTAILLHHWSSVSWETIPFLSHSYWEKTHKTVESPDIFGGLYVSNCSCETSPFRHQKVRMFGGSITLTSRWYVRYPRPCDYESITTTTCTDISGIFWDIGYHTTITYCDIIHILYTYIYIYIIIITIYIYIP